MRELSDWQAARVRDALRAYHRYERGIDGESITWKDVWEGIVVYTKFKIGKNAKSGVERLRQFVEGIEDGKGTGKRKYPLPKPDAIKAIVAFVTHKQLNLLTKDELKENMPGFQAFLRLREYLDDGSENTWLSNLEDMEGMYRYVDERYYGPLFCIRELALQKPDPHGLIPVIETEEWFDERPENPYLFFRSYQERRKLRKSIERHSGWAVFTSEGNLLFFLKNEKTRKNRYLITMAVEHDLWSNDGSRQLVLLQHNYPIKLNGQAAIDPNLEKVVSVKVAANVFAPTCLD